MNEMILTCEHINKFVEDLCLQERSENTVAKYLRDVNAFVAFLSGRSVSKEMVIAYKNKLLDEGYAIRSINSMISSINSLLSFLGWYGCKIKVLKIQRQLCCPEEQELTKGEYLRLLSAARRKGNGRLCLILQTVCATGIRIGELPWVTVEAARKGSAVVSLKGKIRVVWIPEKLQRMLRQYARVHNVASGPIFVTRSGKPINRSNIWREMKSLCKSANVAPGKVFPHNLRHLFAKCFYSVEKDIAKLADILGHSCMDTTRIYLATSGREHRRLLESMHLLL